MKKILSAAFVYGSATVLAACATQPPAPVVTGSGSIAPTRAEDQTAHSSAQPVYMYDQVQASFGGSLDQEQTYLVQPGDTLSQIARHFKLNQTDLAERNSLPKDAELMAGQVLIIPPKGGSNQPVVDDWSSMRFTDRVSMKNRPQETATEPASIAEPAAPTVPQPEQGQIANTTVPDPRIPTQPPAPVEPSLQQAEQGYTYHRVEAGENLFRIGLKYDVSALDLMDLNQIERPEDLRAGQLLKVPLQRTSTEKATAQNVRVAKSKGMIWPVRGDLLYRYGEQRRGVEFTGIAISANAGAPVLAAADGNVIYAAGGLKSYGNLVLVRHLDGLITAYGHLDQIQVAKDQFVGKGQVVGTIGQTGNIDRPQLHFEVRRNARAIDPLAVLPK